MAGILSLVSHSGETRIPLVCSAALRALSEDYIRESGLLRSVCPKDFGVSLNLQFGEQAQGQITVRATEAEQAAILHRLRPFILQRERLYLPTFLSAIKTENRSEVVKEAADFIRDNFFLRDPDISFESQGEILNLEETWQRYVNAHEYHRDTEKKQELDKTFEGAPFLTPYVFWNGVVTKVMLVVQVQGLAAMLCDKRATFAVKTVRVGA